MLPVNDQSAFFQGFESIGYHGERLVEDYPYSDFANPENSLDEVALAGFNQVPPSYRNGCFGVVRGTDDPGREEATARRALGAPLILVAGPRYVHSYAIPASGPARFLERFEVGQIRRVIEVNAERWNPQRIFNAKVLVGSAPGDVQLDFVDAGLMTALEGMLHPKLERMLKAALSAMREAADGRVVDDRNLFRVVFRLLAAKVLRDRRHEGDWYAGDALELLRAVEDYYQVKEALRAHVQGVAPEVIRAAWGSLGGGLHFQNLSVDDLAFVYENTLITGETRRKLGVHSTPPRVAEYVLRKLPIEELTQDQRHVFEPFCGGGVFLVAAMRRLRELLPKDFSIDERHDYLAQRLSGAEVDAFAAEVCRLSLILADYPNPHDWRIEAADVFTWPNFNREALGADIILANPPFENFQPGERATYGRHIREARKPAEFLRRLFAVPQPRQLGLVLPASFLHGNSYRPFHARIAKRYRNVELVLLPEVFNKSDVPSVLLLAWAGEGAHSQVHLSRRTFTKSGYEEGFLQCNVEPPAAVRTVATPAKNATFSLWIKDLEEVWDVLKHLPALTDVAELHQGIHWKGLPQGYVRAGVEEADSISGRAGRREPRWDMISATPKDGFRAGYARAKDCLFQFGIGASAHLCVRPEEQENSAYLRPWELPKVLCGAARLGRSAWRLGAVADVDGMAATQQFHGVWPKANVSVYALAAVLNSPLANAYCSELDWGRDNHIKHLEPIPVPPASLLGEDGKIATLSRQLHGWLKRVVHPSRPVDPGTADQINALLLRVDAEVMKAYHLPPRLERRVLDRFLRARRPLPFEFPGYFPEDFDGFLPLHEWISGEMDLARGDLLLENLDPIDDPEVSKMLRWLNTPEKVEAEEGVEA